ncbi:MAG: NADH-quinone oxidoreductase subunit NuoG [Actinobacteria bacterium]|nr:NADH-quinone oxidoreductase subunit NuoG [Actinomycetota bacterium]
MVRIYIENEPYEIEEGRNLLEACLSLGFDLPYFCWHPALHAVGACRQCAVKQFKDENDTRGKIVMSCMTPAAAGTRISINDPQARAFRAGVIEWLMLNHPHDCPVCDEGGECHLQDMTVMSGHAYRRYRGKKRTFRNQDLGPFINHEMNRCIQCYRCLRFYRDYAGGPDLGVFSISHQVFFGRHEDGALESEFSGNLVEICPTGVFTDKSFKRHYTRKWDLQTAPSVCVHCGLGCNTISGERHGALRRIRNRYNGEVNGYFLCDRGRYGYEFVNSDQRLRHPLLRKTKAGRLAAVSGQAALEHLREMLAGSRGIVGIGSPRATLEANFALRSLVGPARFAAGMSDADLKLAGATAAILQKGAARSASLHEVRMSDAVLLLGEDASNYAPLLALSLRQSVRRGPMQALAGLGIPEWDDAAARDAIQQRKGPLFLATPAATRIDDIAARTYRAAPDELARLGFSVASLLSNRAPQAEGLTGEALGLAGEIAAALAGAERPLIVSGAGLGSEAVIQAAANVAWALLEKGRPAGLCLTLPEANSMGLALMGGQSLGRVWEAVDSGEADTVIILENDLYRRAAPSLIDRLLAASHVIVIDCLKSATVEKAEMVLPAATFAEGEGTLVNSEGRAQRFFRVLPPAGETRESWRWLSDMTAGSPAAGAWQTLDDVIADLEGALPVFQGIRAAAPGAGFRVLEQKIARQSHRYSGRTAITANIDVNEPQPPPDPNSPLAFSMEGFQGQPPPPLIPRYWSPGWNSVQALNKFQGEVGGPLRGGDPGRRLIESGRQQAAYFERVPEPFTPRAGEWLVVFLYHIFGSEELSSRSPDIRQLAPNPHVGLSPGDAAGLQLQEGDRARMEIAGRNFRLPVRLMESLPAGVAGLPVCLPGLEGIVQPGNFARIVPADWE